MFAVTAVLAFHFRIITTAVFAAVLCLFASTGTGSAQAVDLTRDGAAEAPRAASLCDELVRQATAQGACYAYRVFLDHCPGHGYVSLVQATVTQKCTDTVDRGLQPLATAAPLRPWCVKPRLDAAQQTVCADTELAELDRRLEAVFARYDRQTQGTEIRDVFATGRRACATDRLCLLQVYRQTLAALEQRTVPEQDPPAPPQFDLTTDTDLPGGDLTQTGLRGISLAACQQDCRDRAGCRGFAYVVSEQWCWPKGQTGVPVPRAGIVSGRLPGAAQPAVASFVRLPGLDLPGGDQTEAGHKDVSLAQCEALCAQTEDCVAYSYITERQWCWPKRQIFDAVQQTGVASGILR